MQSKATTVDQYMAELPADRRAALQTVREMFRKNLDKDYEEGMGYGMPGYSVPHRVFPAGYHCDPKQPLPFAGFASQKNYMSIYLMCVYGGSDEEERFRAAWAKTGKKLDMGKCCIRFKKIEDVALDVIGDTIRRVPAKAYVERYVATLGDRAAPKSTTKSRSKTATTSAAVRTSQASPTQPTTPAPKSDVEQDSAAAPGRKKSRALSAPRSITGLSVGGSGSKSSDAWGSGGTAKSRNTGRRVASSRAPQKSRSRGR